MLYMDSKRFVALLCASAAIYIHRWRVIKARRKKSKVCFGRLETTKTRVGRRKILVTGGCGFLGREVVKQLLRKEDEVVDVYVLDKIFPSYPETEVTYIRADICDYNQVFKALQNNGRRLDSIIHCAALLPAVDVSDKELLKVNVGGTLNLVEAAKRLHARVFVFTSSSSTVLNYSKFLHTNSIYQTGDESNSSYPTKREDYFEEYAYAKMLCEKILREENSDALRTISLRPSILFGKNDPKLTEAMLFSNINFVLGNGQNFLDYTSVESAARAHVMCEQELSLGKSIGGQEYFIGNPGPTKSIDFVTAFGRRHVITIPAPLTRFLAWLNEFIWSALRLIIFSKWMTRKNVEIMLASWWFSPSLALKSFGYKAEDAVTAVKRIIQE